MIDKVAGLKAIQTAILDLLLHVNSSWSLLIATTVSQVKHFLNCIINVVTVGHVVRPSNYCNTKTLPM